jgi:hypothetical protein
MNAKDLKKLKTNLVNNPTLQVKLSDAQPLVDAGLVEVNVAAGADANGLHTVRATDKLKAELGASGTAAVAAVAKPSFSIDAGVPLIAGVRGGVKEEVYPFSKLEIGQSFVVPVSATMLTPKDVVEKFSSTVSSATRRYAEPSATETRNNKKGEAVPVMVPTRKFTLRPVTQGTKYDNGFTEPVSGARVYRTA